MSNTSLLSEERRFFSSCDKAIDRPRPVQDSRVNLIVSKPMEVGCMHALFGISDFFFQSLVSGFRLRFQGLAFRVRFLGFSIRFLRFRFRF